MPSPDSIAARSLGPLLLLVLSTTAHATPPASITIELGPEQTVFDWDTDRCEPWDIPDHPARAFVDADGKLQLIAGHFDLYRSIGDNLDAAKRDCTKRVMTSHKNATPRQYDDFEWLIAPYTTDGQTIYALVHNEYHGWDHANCASSFANVFNCWWNAITLTRSTDRGKSYGHAAPLLPPAHVVASSKVDFDANNTTGPFGYFAGTNIIRAADGYYYAFLHLEKKGTQNWGVCLMRTQNLASPSSWRGFDGTGFSLALDKGTCPVISRPEIVKMSSHISQNSYLGEYLLVGASGEPRDFHFSTSPKLTSWPQRALLMQTDLWWTAGATKRRGYATLIQPGDPTRNFERTGRSPWLYYTYHDSALGSQNRDLRRRRLRFSLPGQQSRYPVIKLRANEHRGATTLDSAFYGNNGQLEGGASFSNERPEGSRSLAFAGGPGDRVRVAHHASLDLAGSITIEAFVKVDALHATAWQLVAAKDGGVAARNYALFIAPASVATPGVLHLSFSAAGAYSPSVGKRRVDDGKWHHVAVTYSAGDQTARYYIDGLLDVARLHGKALGSGKNTNPLLIGSFLKGGLDRVAVHNYAMSAQEIAAASRGSGNVELCNGKDDDGDSVADEGWTCRRGAIETQACAGGGQRSRTCAVDCNWGAFTACPASDAGGGDGSADSGTSDVSVAEVSVTDVNVADANASDVAAADAAASDALADVMPNDARAPRDAISTDTRPSGGEDAGCSCEAAKLPSGSLPFVMLGLLCWLASRARGRS